MSLPDPVSPLRQVDRPLSRPPMSPEQEEDEAFLISEMVEHIEHRDHTLMAWRLTWDDGNSYHYLLASRMDWPRPS